MHRCRTRPQWLRSSLSFHVLNQGIFSIEGSVVAVVTGSARRTATTSNAQGHHELELTPPSG